jgi:ubiquinone biosynthesis protein UbiJ
MQEENPYLARRWQAEQFQQDVSQLHARTEQLIARAANLQKKITERTASQS